MTQCAKINSWIYGKCRQRFYQTFTEVLFFHFSTFFNLFLFLSERLLHLCLKYLLQNTVFIMREKTKQPSTRHCVVPAVRPVSFHHVHCRCLTVRRIDCDLWSAERRLALDHYSSHYCMHAVNRHKQTLHSASNRPAAAAAV